jgi:SAM-dependent methyltransferase
MRISPSFQREGITMDIAKEVERHYDSNELDDAVLEALRADGKDPDRLSTADLSGADDLHFGWRPATLALAASLGLKPGMTVLDVGAGVGGPARTFAEVHGCTVAGVDLSEKLIRAAANLTQRCGLADRVSFQRANATALPFGDTSFDAAVLVHVGMNLPDKRAVFAEVRRTLKPGGLFGVYDVMLIGDGRIAYPVPWAETAQTSFVERPEAYRALLAETGFTLERETERVAMVLEMIRKRREEAGRDGPSPSRLHALLGPASPERLANIVAALQGGQVAPIEMIARAT